MVNDFSTCAMLLRKQRLREGRESHQGWSYSRWSGVARESRLLRKRPGIGHFQGSGGECQEWQSRQPGRAGASTTQSETNPTDVRELLPGNSNETAGAKSPGFFLADSLKYF